MKPINFPGNYMVVELTNNCNSNCIHCIQDKPTTHFNEKGFMDKELFKELIIDLKENNIKFWDLNLFWLGEPLLHPDFKEVYEFTLQNKEVFGSLNIHTNAQLLNDEIINLLINNQDTPQTWHFSLDAESNETYQKIKRNNKTLPITQIKKLLSKIKGPFPRIVIQLIVQELNHDEAKDFIKFWKNEFNKVNLPISVIGGFPPGVIDNFIFLRQLDCVEDVGEEQIKANKLYKQVLEDNGINPYDKSKKLPMPISPGFVNVQVNHNNPHLGDFSEKKICSGFWKTPVISWNGDVTSCTADNNLQNRIGNIKQTLFSKLWWDSEIIKQKRNATLNQDFKEIPLCEGCIIPFSSNYSCISEEEIIYYKQNENLP